MKRHPIDAFSLIAGLFVTGVAVAALAIPTGAAVGPWVWPAILISAGVVVLALVLAGARERDGDTAATPPVDEERAEALAAARTELDHDVPATDR